VSYLYEQFLLLVKRGNSPLIQCPPYLYDVAACELAAEAAVARQKQEKEAVKQLLKSTGAL
jgi:hypothetical protein